MDKIKLDITLHNLESKEYYKGYLLYGIDANSHCKVELFFNDKEAIGWGTDYFQALQSIRREIEPVAPMLNASLVDAYPSSMSRDMSKGMILYKEELGKQAREEDEMDLLDSVDEPNKLSLAKIQEAHHTTWFMSLGNEYSSLGEGYIAIDKVSKYSWLPNKNNDIEKVKNKDYQYFWLYDKNTNKVYNVSNEKDIKKFHNSSLSPAWNSFNDFLEYYADNWLRER